MKKNNLTNRNLLYCAKEMAVVVAVMLMFSACSKNSITVNRGPQLPAEAIRGTVLNGGNVKGVLLSDSVYTVNGDLTVLPSDTLTIQPGTTINLTGNHAFYIQGIIQSLGTQVKPITFTSTVSQQPGAWGGFQADSAKSVTFYWTKILWAGGPDSSGATRQTIAVSSPIPVDIEDCWFIGGQDNSIGVFSTATVKILRNSFYGNGTTDGDAIDFHSGVTGIVAYNVLWGSAGSAIKVYTSKTVPIAETNVSVYNNTCVESGFRRGAAEPGRGILVDAYSKALVYNNLLVNNYWSLDITPSADYANTKYGNNYFYVTVDSLRQFMYPAGEKGMVQPSDVIDLVNLGANNPMFVGYSNPPNPNNRFIPSSFDFHLKPGSPAIGKGNPTYNNDIGAYTSDSQGNKH
ncbi:MAG: hypothetical protein M3Z26_14660 [Bacteroidota bacterium]|nr:hypothetical protein [Bacteroidota bacterium]